MALGPADGLLELEQHDWQIVIIEGLFAFFPQDMIDFFDQGIPRIIKGQAGNDLNNLLLTGKIDSFPEGACCQQELTFSPFKAVFHHHLTAISVLGQVSQPFSIQEV